MAGAGKANTTQKLCSASSLLRRPTEIDHHKNIRLLKKKQGADALTESLHPSSPGRHFSHCGENRRMTSPSQSPKSSEGDFALKEAAPLNRLHSFVLTEAQRD